MASLWRTAHISLETQLARREYACIPHVAHSNFHEQKERTFAAAHMEFRQKIQTRPPKSLHFRPSNATAASGISPSDPSAAPAPSSKTKTGRAAPPKRTSIIPPIAHGRRPAMGAKSVFALARARQNPTETAASWLHGVAACSLQRRKNTRPSIIVTLYVRRTAQITRYQARMQHAGATKKAKKRHAAGGDGAGQRASRKKPRRRFPAHREHARRHVPRAPPLSPKPSAPKASRARVARGPSASRTTPPRALHAPAGRPARHFLLRRGLRAVTPTSGFEEETWWLVSSSGETWGLSVWRLCSGLALASLPRRRGWREQELRRLETRE